MGYPLDSDRTVWLYVREDQWVGVVIHLSELFCNFFIITQALYYTQLSVLWECTKNRVRGASPAFLFLVSEDKVKNTPSGLKTLKRKSRACNSEQRLASVSARSRTSFFDRVFRDKSLFSPRVSKYFSTTSTSHVDAYLGHGGLLLYCVYTAT